MSTSAYKDALLWLTPTNPYTTPFYPSQGPLGSTTPSGSARPTNASIVDGQTRITYAFGAPGTYAVYDPESSVDWVSATSFRPYEMVALRSAFAAWENVANISFAETSQFETATYHLLATNEAGMNAYFSGSRGIQAFATLPNNYAPNYDQAEPFYSPGWAVFNQDGYGWSQSALVPGGLGYTTVLHEIGHLLGLDHPWAEGGHYVGGTNDGRPEPFFPGATGANQIGDFGLNQGIFTTMGYNDGWKGQPAKGVNYGYQQGPGAFDIAAVQDLYGTRSFHEGDDTYRLPLANQAGTGWSTLWDTGGTDTISAVGATNAATLDLRPATLSSAPGGGGYVSWVSGIQGGFTIANPNGVVGAIIENAVGGDFNDTISGNEGSNVLDGRRGSDTINGFGGNDEIIGGAGRDVLTGGAGSDRFVFTSLVDAGVGNKSRDTIADFVLGQDQIDFSSFENDVVFQYIGNANFSRHAGEIRFSAELLQADVNGDGRVDFEVALQGVSTLGLPGNSGSWLIT